MNAFSSCSILLIIYPNARTEYITKSCVFVNSRAVMSLDKFNMESK